MSLMMERTEVKIPAAPIPAIARAIMSAIMFGATTSTSPQSTSFTAR